jgi:CheY-like chemotaxis protein
LASDRPRIFVVEDEALVLINLEDILDSLGCTVVAQAMNLADAQRLASSVQPDAAILDVNLGGAAVFPAADLLVARGVPILFATGYGRDGLPEAWQDRPVIVKPYTQPDVQEALTSLLRLSV